ncbi:PCI domain-containing protein 2-like [Homalodisca vitripennis]|nr:PCI domain-containing protein 2-like [Homalodisca vitripennis]XP_046686947.1 PCI domain-containing protein 2-like [Homalodisca vitripennis]
MSQSLSSYFSMVNNAWRNKAGEKLADYLSYRHNHSHNPNLQVSNPEAQCSDFLNSPLDEVVAAHLRCINEMKKKNYNSAYEHQTVLVQNLTKVFQGLRDENWLLPAVNGVCLELRMVATHLMKQPGTGTKPLEKAAECLMACFRICTADNRTSEHDTKKWGMMSLVNQLFKVYFRINKLHLMKPLIRAIDSSPLKDRFSLSQQITYRYFVGRMAMFYSDYSTANEYLTYAFTECHVMSKKNKRWILLNLVPVKILLGYMPTREVLKKYDLLQLWEVVVAVKRGCISELSNAMQQHQTFFIKSGIYLIIEKLKIITYRNLAKKVYLFVKTPQMSMLTLLVALQLMDNTSIELEEAHCILANLINEGKVKGYISIQHQKVVLSKIDPFPKLTSLN